MALSIVLERGWPQGQWAWESADPAPVLGNSLSLQIHKIWVEPEAGQLEGPDPSSAGTGVPGSAPSPACSPVCSGVVYEHPCSDASPGSDKAIHLLLPH